MSDPVGGAGPRLRLLDGVTWDGAPVPGGRSGALLARLTLAEGRAVSEEGLVDALWADARPASPAKALQVVVSRTRTHSAAGAVTRAGDGYRLGLGAEDVDALALAALARDAAAAEGGDATRARDLATRALALPSPAETDPDADDPLTELRRVAARQRGQARLVLGRSASALGQHALALEHLEGERDADVDEATLVALLRSEAAVHGVGPALERYERHRRALADAVGADPGPALRAVHAELLARDRPERHGLRHDASSLVGREDDLRAVTALLRGARVVSIVGPGGLGKTRLAHVVSAASDLPVVRFVELVGVSNPDDVVGEVGSALEVRDSVAGLRVLSPEQLRNLRARIAQQLDRAPTLLVLDNCEHLVEAVADLVAYLVAVAPNVRVLTTSRAPLAIAAEHVFPLARLDADDAGRLFRERARAARPGVALDPAAVERVVARLDGLPLAIELAAARVRAMSVDDVARRLDDRFALLRGGDRSAPDRHRTLLAVIEWSWDLLDAPDQDALARLSVFADGFTLDAAERVLDDPAAVDRLESLVDQSLLTLVESGGPAGGLRYRMLETVREFGHVRLRQPGEGMPGEDEARDAVAAWACELGRGAAARMSSIDQVAVVDQVAAEEGNLTDVLHRALQEDDAATMVQVLAALGGCWTIRGEHQRMVAVADAAEAVLSGWEVPDALVDATASTAMNLLMNTLIVDRPVPLRARDLLTDLAPRVSLPGLRASAQVVGDIDFGDPVAMEAALRRHWDDPDRRIAALSLQWSSHALESIGDPAGAIDVAERALRLWEPGDGEWTRAFLLAQVAGLYAQSGDDVSAARYAREGLPLLHRLGAVDDAVQLRAVIALSALIAGRVGEAEQLVDEAEREGRGGWGLGAAITMGPVKAELALAQGRTAEGLRTYRDAAAELRDFRFPGIDTDLEETGGIAPWVVFGVAAATMAHAHAGPEHRAEGQALRDDLASRAAAFLDPGRRGQDLPVSGVLALALGGWELAFPTRDDAADAVRLLALAHRLGYHRFTPSLAFERLAVLAEARAPGRLNAELADVADRAPTDLLPELADLTARL